MCATPSLARELGLNAAARVLATATMTAVMLVLRTARFTRQLPPDRIAEEGIETVTDRPASEPAETLVASVAHIGFGRTAGALSGIATHTKLANQIPPR
jgi:hypothetical protein